MGGFGESFLIGLLSIIVIFLLLREFWCWYWKINGNQAKQLDEVIRLLKSIDAKLSSDSSVSDLLDETEIDEWKRLTAGELQTMATQKSHEEQYDVALKVFQYLHKHRPDTKEGQNAANHIKNLKKLMGE